MKVDRDTFNNWCKEVRDGFCINNFTALPIDLLSPDVVRDMKVDPRSLFDHYNSLSSSYNGLFAQKMNLEDNVSRLRLDVAHLTRSNQRLEKAVADQNELLRRVVSVLEIKLDKQANKAVCVLPVGDIMLFSDSMKRWRKDFSVKETFVRYFTDQCFEGYELEKNSSEFKTKLPREKTHVKRPVQKSQEDHQGNALLLRQLSQTHPARPIKLGYMATSALFICRTGNECFDSRNPKSS